MRGFWSFMALVNYVLGLTYLFSHTWYAVLCFGVAMLCAMWAISEKP